MARQEVGNRGGQEIQDSAQCVVHHNSASAGGWECTTALVALSMLDLNTAIGEQSADSNTTSAPLRSRLRQPQQRSRRRQRWRQNLRLRGEWCLQLAPEVSMYDASCWC